MIYHSSYGKPEVLTAYQLVLNSDLNNFVPFNAVAPTPGGPPGGKALGKFHQYFWSANYRDSVSLHTIVLGLTVPQRDFAVASFVTSASPTTFSPPINLLYMEWLLN